MWPMGLLFFGGGVNVLRGSMFFGDPCFFFGGGESMFVDFVGYPYTRFYVS